MNYNKENYLKVFTDKPQEEELLKASEREPSLSYCVQRWLERTPGFGFHFIILFYLKNNLTFLKTNSLL